MATQWCFGSFRFDPENACLWRGVQVIRLTPKAFAILQCLVKHAGRLVTKEALLEAVWPDTAVSEAVLKVRIGELRRALGDASTTPQFIATVHRRGYRFIAPVCQVDLAQGLLAAGCQRETAADVSVRPLPSLFPPPPYFVGREAVLDQLHGCLAAARHGARQLVFVTGEVGIGKTALVEAFMARASADPRLLITRGQCIEHHGAGEAYLPVLEALGRLCRGPEHERLRALLQREAPMWLVQMPHLLNTNDREALQRELRGATRERMVRELAETLEVLTAERPLVLVLEDLQWSDYATLVLLAFLARRREPARLVLLGTYRPVDVIVSGHPLKAVKQELQMHGRCVELPLEVLTGTEVAAYLVARFPSGVLPPELVHVLHQHTGGQPLFLIHMVEYLLAQGVVAERGGQLLLQAALAEIEEHVPESLRDLIVQQLERLALEEQRVLEAASVAGREFSAAAVAAGLHAEVVAVEEWCEALTRRQQFLQPADVAVWSDGTVAGRYAFVHALYQHVVYQRVAASQRALVRQRIGEREEAAWG